MLSKLLGLFLGLTLVTVIVFGVSIYVHVNKPTEPECLTSIKIYQDGDAISLTNPNGNSTQDICLEWSKP